MNKRLKIILLIGLVLIIATGVVIYFALLKGSFSSQAATSSPSPSPTQDLSKCPNRGTIQVTVKNQSGGLMGGVTVIGRTDDCNRDDVSDQDKKIPVTRVDCLTENMGDKKGKCTLRVPLGNSNFSRYYIKAEKSLSPFSNFYAPIATIFNKDTEILVPVYAPTGNAYNTLIGKSDLAK